MSDTGYEVASAICVCCCKNAYVIIPLNLFIPELKQSGVHVSDVVTVRCVLFSQKHRKSRNRVSPAEVGAVTVTERVSPTTFLRRHHCAVVYMCMLSTTGIWK